MSFTNPAPGAKQGRTDQGVDWSGVRRLVAVASGKIVTVFPNLSGFGQTIIERLNTGQEVYYGEETSGVSAQVHAGETVKQGEQIAGGGSGGGIEVGFWNPNTGHAQGYQPGVTSGGSTAAGQAFRRALGAKQNWKPCMLTWYDPALGGTNSSSGKPDPHSLMANGQPYSPTANICAAPPQYPYGTTITFRYNGKQVTCKVTDRGGAIQGSHFDLGRNPARILGIIQAGAVQAQFIVGSAGSGGSSPSARSRPGGGDTGAAVNQLFTDYVGLRDAPRVAPQPLQAVDKTAFAWWLSVWQSKLGPVFGGAADISAGVAAAAGDVQSAFASNPPSRGRSRTPRHGGTPPPPTPTDVQTGGQSVGSAILSAIGDIFTSGN